MTSVQVNSAAARSGPYSGEASNIATVCAAVASRTGATFVCCRWFRKQYLQRFGQPWTGLTASHDACWSTIGVNSRPPGPRTAYLKFHVRAPALSKTGQ
jgi:hypothetical protein